MNISTSACPVSWASVGPEAPKVGKRTVLNYIHYIIRNIDPTDSQPTLVKGEPIVPETARTSKSYYMSTRTRYIVGIDAVYQSTDKALKHSLIQFKEAGTILRACA